MSSIAPILDLLCIGVFVVLGRESHGVDGGPWWFLTVVWPFAVGWLIAAIALRLYTSGERSLARLAATVVVGIAGGLLLRVLVTNRSAPPAFIVVAVAFIGLTTMGWRVAQAAIVRMVRRRT